MPACRTENPTHRLYRAFEIFSSLSLEFFFPVCVICIGRAFIQLGDACTDVGLVAALLLHALLSCTEALATITADCGHGLPV